MCGIAGFFRPPASASAPEMASVARAMTDAIAHRGPDDSGVWVDGDAGVALGHRRLSILDLSPLGHQPMISADGRFVIVFNGEVYNFQELRAELERQGHAFRGHSDTEVMLAAFSQWGVEAACRRFNGMFAFAVWDRAERRLYLARDRLGEKPLYYGWLGGALVFASELKALRRFPGFSASVDRRALTGLMRFNYIPDPYCIYENVWKLPPASILQVSDPAEVALPNTYWSLREVVERGSENPFAGDEREAMEAFEATLRQAVKLRMVADVPLGAFLSGGVDSSLIVALMQAQSSRPVRTFTIGFDVAEYDEAPFARRVAEHLGTEHTETYVTGRDALEMVPKLPALYDEPFADYSQIPTALVCGVARQHVTVALSGDAGDELFGGYERYAVGRDFQRSFGRMPDAVRRLAAAGIGSVPPALLNGLGRIARPVLPRKLRHVALGDKLHKLAEVIAAPGMETLYLTLMSHWKRPAEIVAGGMEAETAITARAAWPKVNDFTHRMMQLDMETYLPGDILVKVDRAAMGVSLEGRIPLLDPALIEFAWSIPLPLKVRDGRGKWLMRETLYRHVPRELIDRPKRGFGVPLDLWLRKDLRDWAEALLDEGRLRREGYFNPAPILQKWREHIGGSRNWHFYLWDVLMFQAWLEETRKEAAA